MPPSPAPPASHHCRLAQPSSLQLDLSHWQVVWRFADFQHTVLEAASGAIALSLGSPAGAPVRLVDTFTSDGVPGGVLGWR